MHDSKQAMKLNIAESLIYIRIVAQIEINVNVMTLSNDLNDPIFRLQFHFNQLSEFNFILES